MKHTTENMDDSRSKIFSTSSAETAARPERDTVRTVAPTASTSTDLIAAGSSTGHPGSVKPVAAKKVGTNKPLGSGHPKGQPEGRQQPGKGKVDTALGNSSTGHTSKGEGGSNQPNTPSNFDLNWQVVGRRGKPNKGARKPPGPPPVRPLVEGVQKAKKKNKKQRWKARQLRALADATGSAGPGYTPFGPASTARSGTGALRTAAVGGEGVGQGLFTQPTTPKPSTSTQSNRGTQARKQRSAARLRKRDREAARGERLEENDSPQQGEPKRQRTGAPPRASATYASVAKTELGLAITTAISGVLSKDAADSVMRSLHRGLMREADTRAPDDPWGPGFKGKPTWEEGFLKLWCEDQRTADWLKGLVCGITTPAGEALVVKSASEIPQRVRCGFHVPDARHDWENPREIGKALILQNKWAECEKWMLHSVDKQAEGWFLVVSIPERLVPAIIKAGRRIHCGFGTIYLKFQGPGGKFFESPPSRGAEGLKITGVQMPSTSTGASTTAAAHDPPCQREEGACSSPWPVLRQESEEELLGDSPMHSDTLVDEETGKLLSELYLGEGMDPPTDGEPTSP